MSIVGTGHQSPDGWHLSHHTFPGDIFLYTAARARHLPLTRTADKAGTCIPHTHSDKYATPITDPLELQSGTENPTAADQHDFELSTTLGLSNYVCRRIGPW